MHTTSIKYHGKLGIVLNVSKDRLWYECKVGDEIVWLKQGTFEYYRYY